MLSEDINIDNAALKKNETVQELVECVATK